jgi:hypothetical protein
MLQTAFAHQERPLRSVPIMNTSSALSWQFSEVLERASQRLLAASALVACIAGVTSFAAALLVVAVPA